MTRRHGHTEPASLTPGEIYEIRVTLKATGYRFLAEHRLCLSIAGAYWPAPIQRKTGPSRLVLPVAPESRTLREPPACKTSPPDLIGCGWQRL